MCQNSKSKKYRFGESWKQLSKLKAVDIIETLDYFDIKKKKVKKKRLRKKMASNQKSAVGKAKDGRG